MPFYFLISATVVSDAVVRNFVKFILKIFMKISIEINDVIKKKYVTLDVDISIH